MPIPTRTIVLASASPQRKTLLKKIVATFKIAPADIDEALLASTFPNASPHHLASQLAEAKARAVAIHYSDAIVIGSDTLVVLGNKILGKPKNEADARRILTLLSGSVHDVCTGVFLLDTKNKATQSKSITTTIHMRHMTGKDINAYIASGEPFGKAGAYAIQENGDRFVQKIDGDFDNVVGLPVSCVQELLEKLDQ